VLRRKHNGASHVWIGVVLVVADSPRKDILSSHGQRLVHRDRPVMESRSYESGALSH